MRYLNNPKTPRERNISERIAHQGPLEALVVAYRKPKPPPKPQFARMIIRNTNLHALTKLSLNRLGNRVGGNKAVQFVIGDADNRPAHRHQRIRPP